VKFINVDGMSKSSAVILNFLILQGSAATQLRWGGRPCNIYNMGICQWKNFEHQSTFAEVMIKSRMYCFPLRHSVQICASLPVEVYKRRRC